MVNYQTSSAQQTFLKIFLILLLLIAYFSPYIGLVKKAYADSFYPNFNISNCQLSNINGVSYSSLGSGVEYNSSDVKGVDSNWITSHRFTDVATPYYPDAHRYDDIADRVAVPPNSKVDIGLFVWNYTSHDVFVNSADIFTSRSNPEDGDITKLGADGIYGSSCWNTNTGQDCRSGKKVSVPVQSNYAYHGNEVGKILYSFNTIQPVQLQSITPNLLWDGPNLKVRYDFTLKNVSTYNLCNINISHVMPSGETHNENVCINANSSSNISYFANFGTNYPLTISNGSIKITDPNRHTEIVASSNTSSFRDEKSIVVWRDDKDHNSPAGVYGAQPGWGNTKGTFGVELIPYSFNVNVPDINLKTEIQYSELVKNITAEDNGRVNQIYNKEFLPGDEVLYTYNLKNIGTTKTTLNFTSQIEKDNQIYNYQILSKDISDQNSTITTNSLQDKEEILINIPEFGVGEVREIKIRIKIFNVSFSEKKIELENYESEMNFARELKTKINITNSTSNDVITSEVILNMKLADASINISSDKSSYENFESPLYKFELNNPSVYRVSLSPFVTLEGQQSEHTPLQDLFIGDGIWIENNTKIESNTQTEFTDSFNQTSAKLSLISFFQDENSNTYPMIINELEVGVKKPELIVSKRIIGNENYTIGDLIRYEIEVKNIGGGIAKEVTLTDTLNDYFTTDSKNLDLQGGIYDSTNRKIKWELGDINSMDKIIIKFTLEVNKEINFSDKDQLINSVTAKALNEATQKQSESLATLRCASINGIAWEDTNKNQIVDIGEKYLSNQIAKVLVEWRNENDKTYSTYDLTTDNNGKFILDCVPYNRVIKVLFTKPLEYLASSSPIEYIFMFSNQQIGQGNLSELTLYEQDSSVEMLSISSKEVLMGLYNEEKEMILAVTGESTNYGLLASVIFFIPGCLVLLKRIKFKKFCKESERIKLAK